MNERIVIIGAGHAGGTAAALLRQHGWQGAITLIGEEPVTPYQHPPLSKTWLTTAAEEPRIALRPDNFYTDKNIEMRLDTRVVEIDRAARDVILESNERIGYGRLILATGCRARQLKVPGIDFANVFALRSIADARRLKSAIRPGCRLAIIGGGYIGLEVAASACTAGMDATVIERESRLLARVASPLLSSFFHDAHHARGVEIELSADVAEIAGLNARATSVRLADGRTIDCDAVLVGVGVSVNEELAAAAGLVCENGVVVDMAARTSDPAIYAIGDCTRRPLALYGQSWR
ncbi:MAG: FAD-dependent oxidoreductase, partial [Betaproteobacteria bacterium]